MMSEPVWPTGFSEDRAMVKDRMNEEIARLLGQMEGLLDDIAEQAKRAVTDPPPQKRGG